MGTGVGELTQCICEEEMLRGIDAAQMMEPMIAYKAVAGDSKGFQPSKTR